MAETYTQVHIHFVFAVAGRTSLIAPSFRVELEQYITGIITKRGHKLLAIYCMPDHAHILVGKRPTQSESDLVRDIKTNSSTFIREKGWVQGKFAWQNGFGAFSYSKSHVPNVVRYILNQEEHHRKRRFKDEYLDLLRKFEVDHDARDLFVWLDDLG
jgi:putative transposase